MNKSPTRREDVEQPIRRGIAEALKTAFPVDMAASFNSDVAALLGRLSTDEQLDEANYR